MELAVRTSHDHLAGHGGPLCGVLLEEVQGTQEEKCFQGCCGWLLPYRHGVALHCSDVQAVAEQGN